MWRLVTTFTYFGSVGHNMLMETVFMLNYSKSMESLYNGTLTPMLIVILLLILILTPILIPILITILTLRQRQEHGVAVQRYLHVCAVQRYLHVCACVCYATVPTHQKPTILTHC